MKKGLLLALLASAVSAGCSFDEPSESQLRPLTAAEKQFFIAARRGAVEEARAALAENSTLVDIRDDDGMTPLHVAFLGAFGRIADAYKASEYAIPESMPLYRTVSREALEIAELLVASGTDLNAVTSIGETPLHWAVFSDELVVFLISEGAVPKPNMYGATPLHFAARMGHPVSVKALLRAGASPNALDGHGETPLHSAASNASNGHLACIRALLLAGADPSVKNECGESPADLASFWGFEEAVDMIVVHSEKLPQETGARSRGASASPE